MADHDPTPEAALRPRRANRGRPEETRERLTAAAAVTFNRRGYGAVDAAAIAAEAGYAVGTFYRHFDDKRAALIAAYERWVAGECRDLLRVFSEDRPAEEIAPTIVQIVLEAHVRWRGLRSAFFSLLDDPEVRAVYVKQRAGQFRILETVRSARGGELRTREQDAVLLLLFERTCDAIANGDMELLGLDRSAVDAILREALVEALG